MSGKNLAPQGGLKLTCSWAEAVSRWESPVNYKPHLERALPTFLKHGQVPYWRPMLKRAIAGKSKSHMMYFVTMIFTHFCNVLEASATEYSLLILDRK